MSTANLLAPCAALLQSQPDRLALWVDGEETSYGQLFASVQAIAGWIASLGAGPNPRVAILAVRSRTAYTGVLAAAWAGAAYVPLNARAPVTYLEEILRAARPQALLVDEVGMALLRDGLLALAPGPVLAPFCPPPPGLQGRVATSRDLEALQPQQTPAPVSTDQVAYLMFTSGTTGKPKGIAVTVGNVNHLLRVLQDRYRLAPEDRVSQAFELTFDLSVFDIFMTLRAGASLHVLPGPQMVAPARFIRQQQLSVWFSVPSLIGLLAQMRMLPPGVFPTLRLSLFCGEALPSGSAGVWQAAAPNSRVENLYGPTEATVACLLQDCGETGAVTPGRGIVAIGKPFPGLHAAILGPDHQFLPPGTEGELAIAGPQVTPGYWDNAPLTAERFPTLDHPEMGPRRWYLTGDRARQDATGRFHFLGRVDNQVQVRGNRVELDAVDFHLRELSGCDQAVAVFVPGREPWDNQIVGAVAAKSLDAQTLRNRLSLRLPAYMVPQRIVRVDSFPRNASGKIDRNALCDLFRRGTPRSDA